MIITGLVSAKQLHIQPTLDCVVLFYATRTTPHHLLCLAESTTCEERVFGLTAIQGKLVSYAIHFFTLSFLINVLHFLLNNACPLSP